MVSVQLREQPALAKLTAGKGGDCGRSLFSHLGKDFLGASKLGAFPLYFPFLGSFPQIATAELQTSPGSAHHQAEQTRRGGRRNYPGDPFCDSPAAAVLSWPRRGETMRVTLDYRSQLLLTRGQPRLPWPMVQQELSACMASLHTGSYLYNLPELPFSSFYPCKSLLCHCVAIISLPLILRQFDSYVFQLKWVASPGKPHSSAEQGVWILMEADGSFVFSVLKRSFLHLVLVTGTKWGDEISISGHQDSSQCWRNCLEEQQYCTEW